MKAYASKYKPSLSLTPLSSVIRSGKMSTEAQPKNSKHAMVIGLVLAGILAGGLGFMVCSIIDMEDSLKVAKEETAPAINPPAPKLLKVKFTQADEDNPKGDAKSDSKDDSKDDANDDANDSESQSDPSALNDLSSLPESNSLRGMQITPVSQLNLVARGFMDNQNYPAAIEKFTEAIAEFKRNKNPYEHGKLGLVVALQNRGYCKLMNKDYKGAIPDLTEAIKISPHYRDNYINRAEAYRMLGMEKEYAADIGSAKQLESRP